MTAAGSRRVRAYRLVLPAEWLRVPLDAAAFERFARRQRRRLAAEATWSRPAQRQFANVLQELRNSAVRHGVVLAAVSVSAGGAGAAQVVRAAACMLATVDRSALATTLPLTVHTLLAAAARSGGGIEVDPPAAIELPGGAAVRLVRHHVDSTDGRVHLLGAYYLIPHGDGARAAVLTLTTPNVELGNSMLAEFARIAGTLRLLTAAEPAQVDPADATVVAA